VQIKIENPGKIIAAISMASLFFLLNQQVPLFADDFCRVTVDFDLSAIVQATAGEYQSWTGRFPVIFLNRVFLSAGDTGLVLFNTLNSLCLLLCCYLTIDLCLLNANSKNNTSSMLLVAGLCFVFLLWFSPHRFGEVVLWKTGAIQYFWGCVIALIALRPLIKLISDGQSPNASIYSVVPYVLVCFIGGAWLENLSIALFVIFVGLMLFGQFYQRISIPKSLGLGCLAWAAGLVLLVAAPGNYARIEVVADTSTFFDKLMPTISHLYTYLSKDILFTYCLFLTGLLVSSDGALAKRFLLSFTFLALGVLSLLAMIAAPLHSFVGRAAFPYEFFLIFSVMCLFPHNLLTGRLVQARHTFAWGIVSLPLVVALLASYGLMFNMYSGVSEQTRARQEVIGLYKMRGMETEIPLPALYFGTLYSTVKGDVNIDRYFARDITTNIDHWKNVCYAKAHHIRSVKIAY